MKVGLKKQKFLLLVIAVVTCLIVLLSDLAFSRFTSSKAYACDSGLSRLDPTCPGRILNPGDRIGDVGAGAYQAAAEIMQANNGSSQSLDEMQKRYLRPHFGNLVDRVVVIYNANLMDEWSALGYRVDLGESAAQTYCNRVYLDDPYQARDLDQIILLAHELVHSRQCESFGGAGDFGWHYFKEYYEGGNSYRNNRLEREAFDFEAQFANIVESYPPITRLGFYREGNQDTVYLVFRSTGSHCSVQNRDQMNTFGGFNQVQSVPYPVFGGEFTGGCGWTNGFYRLGNQDAVYRLYGNRVPEFNIGDVYCHVANRAQMEAYGGFGQIRSISSNSELFRGRSSVGACPNP